MRHVDRHPDGHHRSGPASAEFREGPGGQLSAEIVLPLDRQLVRGPRRSDAVCGGAVKDLDCPDGGCFGIGFTLPQEFATDPSPNPRPAGAPLNCPTETNKDWNVSFVEAGDGACAHPNDLLKLDFADAGPNTPFKCDAQGKNCVCQ
jgi:hypothetical protein